MGDTPWLAPELAIPIIAVGIVVVYALVIHVLERLLDERRQSEQRAEKLLAELLTPEEYDHLQRRGYLEIASRKHLNRVYRIPRHQGLVSVYEEGRLADRLCVGSTVRIPNGDVVLMHKLMIEGNEEEYLRVANHFAPRPYSFPL